MTVVESEDADAVFFALEESLYEGTTYYWRVRALYSPSGESDWSPVWSFLMPGDDR